MVDHSNLLKVTIDDEDLKSDYMLKNLTRFNTAPRITNESVAEHSYFVVYYAYILSRKIGFGKGMTNLCMMKALLHDVAEKEISDVPHNIKQKYPEIKEALKKAEIEWYQKNHKEYLHDGKKYDIIDYVVELADIYSVRQYCLYEISLGNSNMEEILKSSYERILVCQNEIAKLMENRRK